MKKIFTLLVALVATTALWAEDFKVDGIYYNILTDKTNEVEVTYQGDYCDYYSNEYSGSVTIPSTVTYNGTTYSVTRIGGLAFFFCSGLTSITIPNSVTSIGGAFYGCSGLTSITIPNSVTSIGGAFYGCKGLTSITIPNSVTSIGEHTFYECTGLTSIEIPESVTSIGERAFEGCSSLTSITIPESVTSIGSSAFRGCSSLPSITIPNSVTSIGNYAFYSCSSLTSITIPNSVTSIGNYAFHYCRGLTSVTIPNSVTSIGDAAFRECYGLTSITIPNSVTSIGEFAFERCSGLTSIIVEEGNSIYDSRKNCNAIIETNSNTLVAGCKKTTIPNSVTSIGERAFYFCSDLWSITIPNSVTSIGDEAFYWCTGLTSVTLGNSVTSIGDEAFYWCKGLTSITIPNSVTSIGERAFYECTGLTSVNVFAEVPPTLGTNAFYNVSTTIPVYVPCGSAYAYQSAEGWNKFTNIQELQMEYSIQVYTSNRQMGSSKVNYNNCTGNQISATPNIGYHFVQWSDGNTDNPRTLELTQDTILTAEFAQTYSGKCGDNLYWAYDENNKTISITGSGDMYDYTKATQPWLLFQEQITEVTTSNTTTGIGTSAFEGCIRLGKISLGTGLEEIAANAFAGCTRLYDIYTYATYPPFVDESSFANYNAYLYVPCDSKRDYTLDPVWGKFQNIECLSDEPTDIENIETPLQSPTNVQKLFRNGQLIIVRDGVEYNAMGQEL